MAIPVWPGDLPQRVLSDGYSYGFADGRLKTAMERGPPKTRRGSSAAVKLVSAQIYGDQNDIARLERFWIEDLAHGALPFLIPDQNRDELALVTDDGLQLLDDQGRRLINTAWWLVLFGETPPQAQPVSGMIHRSTFTLTVLP